MAWNRSRRLVERRYLKALTDTGGTLSPSFSGDATPYVLSIGRGTSVALLPIWYLNDSGVLQKMTAYDESTDLSTFTAPHLSYYVVGYSAPRANPFSNVKSTGWFFDAVKCAAKK